MAQDAANHPRSVTQASSLPPSLHHLQADHPSKKGGIGRVTTKMCPRQSLRASPWQPMAANRHSFQRGDRQKVADLSRSLGSISVADLDDKRRGQERRQRSIQQLEILPAYLPS